MKRFLGIASAGLVAIGGAVALVAACAENDQTIFIRQVLLHNQAGDCTIVADPQRPYTSSGLIDVAVRNTYSAPLLIGNQLIARGDPISVRAESSRVHIKGAVVRVLRSDGSEIRSYTRLATGIADPSSGTAPGFGIVFVDILDGESADSVGQALQPGQVVRLVSAIKVFGTTTGGKDVESGEFEFPIDVCKGCLVSATPDPTTNQCCTGTSGTTQTATSCAPGQDRVTDCFFCRARDVPNGGCVLPDRCRSGDGGTTPVADAGTD